jgi:putative ABC transport system permease protein
VNHEQIELLYGLFTGQNPMSWIALRMLTGDTAKYLGMVFGVAFSVLLISQQSAIFVGLIDKSSASVAQVADAEIWVMDTRVQFVDGARGLPDTALQRVRGVPGVAWAAPHLRGATTIATSGANQTSAGLVGVDDSTLIGLPRQVVAGSRKDLNAPGAVMLDKNGWQFLFKDRPFQPGLELEINDVRATVVGLVETNSNFNQQVTVYARYNTALNYAPGGRNRLSYVLVRVAEGLKPEEVANRIEAETGLKAMTRSAFEAATQRYVIFNTGIPQSVGSVVVLGVIVGIVIVALTFSLFIRDNARQFGALRAIGVSNWQLTGMVLLQGALVGAIGYGIGLGAAAFLIDTSAKNVAAFKGFYVPAEVAAVAALIVVLIIAFSGMGALRRVLTTDPATVFRG